MINGKTVLAIIPARGGSKRLPGKNTRMIAGKPLIAWTIEEAKKSKYIDRLILSSEDNVIIKTAKEYGCEVPFVRPIELASDETPGIDVVIHAINTLQDYDYIVLLQPTSPLRVVSDIDNSIEKCVSQNAKACVSLTEAPKSPYWMYFVNENDKIEPIMTACEGHNRNQLLNAYVLNGAVYVAECGWLLKNKKFTSAETVGYIMPEKRSIDVDNELDFILSEMLLKYDRI